MSELTNLALEVAISQIGVRETKRNRGPEVDAYLIAVGLDPTKGSYPWCAAFMYWCHRQAAKELRAKNPMVKTASVMKLWARTPYWFRRTDPVPGAIFVIDHGGGRGHTGVVEWVTPTALVTIEGNSNEKGEREGVGVFRLTHRRRSDMAGFIDYGQAVPELVA